MDKRVSQRRATIEKHKGMSCKVFECKVDFSKLSENSIKHLTSLFTEAKWFYNYCLSQDDIDKTNTTVKSVPVKVKDIFEERTFNVLGSQMKQAIKTRLFGSMASLKALKQTGHKTGKLKFKSKLNSVPLKQYGVTYRIDFDKGRIQVQGLKTWLKVKGLKQVEGLEIANSVLIKKPSGYYFKITTFGPKEENIIPNKSIGIDFGCQTQLTLSNGTKIEFQVPVSPRVKQLDKELARKKTDSKNRFLNKVQRERAYEKLNNKKKDIRNKVVSAITKNFKYVCFQDESVHAWTMGGHGKKIQNSGIGGIIADLKHKSHTPLLVNKFFPSTKLCPICGTLNKFGLNDRIYSCDCGYVCDRDGKSSICIETEGLKQVPTEHRDFKVQENSTSAFDYKLSKINGLVVSKWDSMNARSPRL